MKHNEFNICGSFTEVLTIGKISKLRTGSFLIDTEDIKLIKNYYWSKFGDKIFTKKMNKQASLLSILLEERNLKVIFKNSNKFDFRRENLIVQEKKYLAISSKKEFKERNKEIEHNSLQKLKLLDVDYIMSVLAQDREKTSTYGRLLSI